MLAQSKATATLIVALGALLVNAAVPLYGQCGGLNYSGETTCVSGACCQYSNDWYSQCLSCSSGGTTTTPTTTTSTTTKTSSATTSTSTASGLNLLAKAHNRYFGTAVDGIWSSTDTTWLNLANNFNEFGMITPGNAMKMDSTEPSRNSFNYAHADYTVTWAHAHKQVIRGHTLVWHSQVPSWVTNGGFNNATLISIMQNHITNEVTHFKGQVYAWDVVNECFNDDGTWRTSSVWYSTIGSSFVSIALRAAAAADPNAKLYINDYNIDGLGSKSDAHYNNAKSLLAQGVPLHGIGSQGHLIVNSIPTTIPSNIARFVALGLEFAFTELDIRMPTPATSSNLAIQASNYATVVSACTGSAGCVGVTTWDVSDDHSWIPGTFPGYGAALLFDSNKQPKPAYTSVANVLASATVNGHFTSWI